MDRHPDQCFRINGEEQRCPKGPMMLTTLTTGERKPSITRGPLDEVQGSNNDDVDSRVARPASLQTRATSPSIIMGLPLDDDDDDMVHVYEDEESWKDSTTRLGGEDGSWASSVSASLWSSSWSSCSSSLLSSSSLRSFEGVPGVESTNDSTNTNSDASSSSSSSLLPPPIGQGIVCSCVDAEGNQKHVALANRGTNGADSRRIFQHDDDDYRHEGVGNMNSSIGHDVVAKAVDAANEDEEGSKCSMDSILRWVRGNVHEPDIAETNDHNLAECLRRGLFPDDHRLVPILPSPSDTRSSSSSLPSTPTTADRKKYKTPNKTRVKNRPKFANGYQKSKGKQNKKKHVV